MGSKKEVSQLWASVHAGASQGWVADNTLIDDQYTTYVGTRENAYFDRSDGDSRQYWFVGGRKINWRDCLVDDTVAPSSRAQAQDPAWSNYK